MTRVPSLPCGWTYSDDEACFWVRRANAELPLQLTEDLAALVDTPGDQSMEDVQGVAAAAHIAQFHEDDERLAAVGPTVVYAPLEETLRLISDYLERPWWKFW